MASINSWHNNNLQFPRQKFVDLTRDDDDGDEDEDEVTEVSNKTQFSHFICRPHWGENHVLFLWECVCGYYRDFFYLFV